jgi:hypothetical protein
MRRLIEMHCAVATDLNFDMSSLTPLTAPGVTDDPVFDATVPIDTPADSSHCMVNISRVRAAFIVKDSFHIFIEATTSLNCYGERTQNKSSFAILALINLEDLNNKSALFDLALALDSDVRVMTFSHLAARVINASEGIIGRASVATLIGIAAVNHLLLRELNLFAIFD